MCAADQVGATRHVWFLTGTRADYGKLKPLIQAAAELDGIEATVVVTGMHMLEKYGSTINEVRLLSPAVRIREFVNQDDGDTMDRVLARTVEGLADLFDVTIPDLLVVHGDRVEALAGATAGALRNVRVAHVEGGELSGTIDGVVRHAVSKLSHLHLVANEEARRRVVQLGEHPSTVIPIGSPDIDVMLSDSLPALDEVRAAYEIDFERYSIAMMHGVTTGPAGTNDEAGRSLVGALLRSGANVVVIHPNNDPGSDRILHAYEDLADNPRFRLLPSMRFEAFLTLLRHADVLVGNSSAGVREAPIYSVPSINIGDRQRGRTRHALIFDVEPTIPAILSALDRARAVSLTEPDLRFGRGDSAERFASLLDSGAIWGVDLDKVFHDMGTADMSTVPDVGRALGGTVGAPLCEPDSEQEQDHRVGR